MKLPNGERAELGTKLDDYVLNPLHPHGKHKARLFETALGITLLNAEVLRQGLLEAAAKSNAAEARGDNRFGLAFILRFPMAITRVVPQCSRLGSFDMERTSLDSQLVILCDQ
jgi:hypothetical protein